MKNKTLKIIILLVSGIFLRFFLMPVLEGDFSTVYKFISIILILVIGAVYTLRGAANIIEETTDVLSEKTKLAGGLLQSLGTAFPDMVLGIVAALVSLRAVSSDPLLAVNYAIIAASTTFGSNIYNIGHATWCIYRQNLSNSKKQLVLMFPGIKSGGTVKPVQDHTKKPSANEIDTAIDVSNALTVLTALVALSMVMFGQVSSPPPGLTGDLYQLIRPIGVVIFLISAFILFLFRKDEPAVNPELAEVVKDTNYYRKNPLYVTWLHLAVAGLAILFAAESMVKAIETFCNLTGIPFVIAGVAAGLIGCLGEMLVVHNYTVHPDGRIGDAVVGVAMDNIVTIMGASIVAMMGGIFLGGKSLIMIFVIIFALNSTLMWQIGKLKNYLLIVKYPNNPINK